MQHSCLSFIPSHTPSQGRWNDIADPQIWKKKHYQSPPLGFLLGVSCPQGCVFCSAFLGTKVPPLGRDVVSQSDLLGKLAAVGVQW